MKTVLNLLILSLSLIQVHAITLVGRDDFNDNTVNPAWVPLFTSSGVAFSEINQRLEFTGTGGFVGWNWTSNTLSAAEDWAIAIDLVYSVDPSVQASGEETALQFGVEAGGTDAFQIKYFLKDDGFNLLTQHGDIVTDIGYGLDYRSIFTNQISVRIDYDASAEMISASYDDGSGFTTTTNYSVSSWGLSPSSTFLPLVSVDNESIPFSSGGAYFDNFQVFVEDTQPVVEEDDFNDNSIDSSKWNELDSGGGAVLTEQNEMLELIAPGVDDAWVEWKWIPSSLSYTQHWAMELDIDVPMDSTLLTNKLVYAGFAVQAEGYWFEIDLFADEGGVDAVSFVSDPGDNNILGESVPLNGLSATVRIEFDADSKMLNGYFGQGSGFVHVATYSAALFGMSDSSVFIPLLFAGSEWAQVVSGQVSSDNFKIIRGKSYQDDDEDNLPDEWEVNYWGSIGHPDANPDADPDTDGNGYRGSGRNWAEWIMGTDPTNANSILKLAQPREILGAGYVIEWDAVTGRVYTVDWTDYLANSFQTLETNIAYPQNSYTDMVHSAEDGGFYNLKVELE
jgi:hypothetical protein